MLPAMVKGFGFCSAFKVGSWLSAWSTHDPAAPHIHLGPIGVAPEAQGLHIGRCLMERYCEELDRTNALGYLETDRPANVEFYKRFGFEVTETAPILRVVNYFMRRKAKVEAAA
jgi:ribosomal protein S18 acetylase RimI-like enzyme